MKHKNPIIRGALLLIAAGFITRIIGFFYRIFLSRTIGAEGMGLYNLIFPVYGIVSSISIAPIQTSISRFVAAERSSKREGGITTTLFAGIFLSLSLTTILSLSVYFNAEWIASNFLSEARCTDLLKVLALSLPFSSIHSCINGYYYGIQKATTPSMSQLAEQIVRVFAVYTISTIALEKTGTVTPMSAVTGIVIGDAASMLYCILSISFGFKESKKISGFKKQLNNIFQFSVPLAVNRLFLSILHSIEAVLIPLQLKLFGLPDSDAISLFGVFTGMAMPFIQFPSAIPNAIAVMLLPEVAAATGIDNNKNTLEDRNLSRSSTAGIQYSLLLGILCIGIFLVYGNDMGRIIFNSTTAGQYISILSWLCPFLYLTTTLGSILNGLGNTAASFVHSVIATLIRLGFVFFGVPMYGIIAYLYGTLVSQMAITLLHYLSVRKKVSLNFNALRVLVWPTIILLVSLLITQTVTAPLSNTAIMPLLLLVIRCGFTGILYLVFLAVFRLLDAHV